MVKITNKVRRKTDLTYTLCILYSVTLRHSHRLYEVRYSKGKVSMAETVCTVIVSLFFVYGLYSAGVQIKLLLYKLVRRISEIDKNKT